MTNITPSSQIIEHVLTGTGPVNYATLGNVTVVEDETYDQADFDIETAGPEGQEIVNVNSTDIMLTSTPKIINDGVDYFMEFQGTLAIMVESSSAYFLLQQVITFNANLGPITRVAPPPEIDLPIITLSASNASYTTTSVTSTVTVDSFEIPVGESKSVKVALDATDPIGDAIF